MKLERKTIIYLIIVAIAVFIFVMALINKYLPNNKTTSVVPEAASVQTGTITNLGESIGSKIFFPGLSSSGTIDYLGDKGIIFYRFAPSTQEKTKIWDSEVLGGYYAIYSPDGNYAIVKSNYPEQKNIYFDFLNKTSKDLDSKMNSIVFTPNNQKIIYAYYDEEKNINTLNIAEKDGSNWQKLYDFNESKIYNPILVISPDGNKLAVYPAPEGYGQNPIYVFDINSKVVSKISDDKPSVAPVWSPDSQKIIYEVIDLTNLKPTLWVMNADGSSKQDTAIKAFTEKLVWSDDNNLIIALDENLPDNFASDLTYTSQDSFWSYNTENGNLTKINTGGTLPAVKNMMYDKNGKVLYFTSNDVLYKLIVQ